MQDFLLKLWNYIIRGNSENKQTSIPCIYCKELIHKDAKKCPKCNEWIGKRSFKHSFINNISLVQFLLSFFISGVTIYFIYLTYQQARIINQVVQAEEFEFYDAYDASLVFEEECPLKCVEDKGCFFLKFYVTIINNFKQKVIINKGLVKLGYSGYYDIYNELGFEYKKFTFLNAKKGNDCPNLYSSLKRELPMTQDIESSTKNLKEDFIELETGRNIIFFKFQVYLEDEILMLEKFKEKINTDSVVHNYDDISIFIQLTSDDLHNQSQQLPIPRKPTSTYSFKVDKLPLIYQPSR